MRAREKMQFFIKKKFLITKADFLRASLEKWLPKVAIFFILLLK